jgi:hypothetical protein
MLIQQHKRRRRGLSTANTPVILIYIQSMQLFVLNKICTHTHKHHFVCQLSDDNSQVPAKQKRKLFCNGMKYIKKHQNKVFNKSMETGKKTVSNNKKVETSAELF